MACARAAVAATEDTNGVVYRVTHAAAPVGDAGSGDGGMPDAGADAATD